MQRIHEGAFARKFGRPPFQLFVRNQLNRYRRKVHQVVLSGLGRLWRICGRIDREVNLHAAVAAGMANWKVDAGAGVLLCQGWVLGGVDHF